MSFLREGAIPSREQESEGVVMMCKFLKDCLLDVANEVCSRTK